MQGIDVALTYTGVKGNIALMRLKGFLDTTTSGEVTIQLRDILNNGIYRLVVDMSRVNYVSSAGWGVFVGEIRSIRENGGDLKIVQMTPDVYEVFEMLEFDRILDYYETIEESINDFDLVAGFDITRGNEWKVKPVSAKPVDFSAPLPKEIATKALPQEERKSKSRFSFTKPKVDEASLPLVEKIKLLVIDNPNDNAWKIKKKLNAKRFGFEKVSIFKVMDILKKYNLDSKEKRYRFYRSR